MLSEDTKKPAKSINGMIKTGVRVTASCLSEKEAEMIREYPLEALYIRIKIVSNIMKFSKAGLYPIA